MDAREYNGATDAAGAGADGELPARRRERLFGGRHSRRQRIRAPVWLRSLVHAGITTADPEIRRRQVLTNIFAGIAAINAGFPPGRQRAARLFTA